MYEYRPVPYRSQEARTRNLRDILTIFFRRRWIIVGIALPIIVFSIVGTLKTVDSFSANSQVLIETVAPELPSFKNSGVDYSVLMSTAAQVACSIPVAEIAAAALMDSLPVLRDADPRFAMIQTEEDLRDLLLGKVDAGQVGESNILNISYADPLPKFALMAVGAMTDAYIEYSIKSKQNLPAISYYTEQINELLADIDSLMVLRAKVFAENGLAAFKANNNAGFNQMRDMEFSYLKTRTERKSLEKRLAAIQASIARDPDYVPRTPAHNSLNMIDAQSTLNEAKLELARLRLSYSDSSLHVIRQRELLEKTREIFRHERADYLVNLEVELAEIREREEGLRLSIESYRGELLAFPELDTQLQSYDIQIEAHRDLLETLQLKRGEVRISAEGDLRVSSIIPLNEPSLGLAIGAGKKFIYLALAGLLAVALGFVGALFVDMNDHRIFSRGQAAEVLELPVLGAVSKTPQLEGKPR